MEFALFGTFLFGALVGFKVGYSRGVKVNRPVGDPAPTPVYDERADKR